MRAVRQLGHGGPEVLEIAEVQRPVPGADGVLVRVRAAAVNPADWKIREGTPGHVIEAPFTPGLDVAGVVEAIGPEVTRFRPGEAVFGNVFPPNGAQAEYVVASADMLAAAPSELDLIQAGALPTTGLTAWQALVRTAEVRAGQRVLIHAAAGGVGHLAVQIAKAHGAYVIGTARSEKHGFLRELGADELIDYTAVDFATAVKEPVDVVLDPLSFDHGPRSLPLIARGGVLIDLVHPGPDRTELRARAGELGVRFEQVVFTPGADDLMRLASLASGGELRVAVELVLPLTDVVKAQELVATGRVRGKIVLVP
jgi:NADPH:quinone reductase-like Zn-dependent oxidoreductase